MTFLHVLARQGRWTLVAGLVAGLFLPGPAAYLTPWLPHLVALLLVLTAFRLGWARVKQGLSQLKPTLRTVLILQLALPLIVAVTLGWTGSLFVLALVLMLAAAPIVGGANMAIMLGADPDPAFRTLILGTALLPLTIIPVFWAMPALGDLTVALAAAARLALILTGAIAIGLAMRRVIPDPDTQAVDGLTSLTLAVLVVGLMSAFTPTLLTRPGLVIAWLAFAVVINFGTQITAARLTGNVAESIIAGNRNISVFLVALPTEISEPLLVFLACYQLPMFLTPMLMGPVFRRLT